MTIAEKILQFNKALKIPEKLPEGAGVLFPFSSENVIKATTQFYKKYYSDREKRTLILGINPGRFGAGVTGIPFTDPIKLEQECGINNDFNKRAELSSDYVYQFIKAYGGVSKFYSKFIISSISPLGFVRDGKNLNYYDDKELENSLYNFIIKSIQDQVNIGVDAKTVFCLGEGKNYKYLQKINAENHFFENIIPLAHPRYIMQYKRKNLNDYIQDYLLKLHSC